MTIPTGRELSLVSYMVSCGYRGWPTYFSKSAAVTVTVTMAVGVECAAFPAGLLVLVDSVSIG